VTERQNVVLIVEDDKDIQRFLRITLEAEGYRVAASGTGERGIVDAGTHKADIAIVDLALPGIDGLEVIRRLRAWSSLPIVVLSARTHERWKVDALDAGADDYVAKPFATGELLARIRSALRRAARPTPAGVLSLGNVTIDFDKRLVLKDGVEVRLTPIEVKLLVYLARNVGLVVTHRQLLTEVWGPTHSEDTHYLRVYMNQLRQKIEEDPVRPRYLRTEIGIGIGYRMTEHA
jgi:two-component system KDP operon response regulator KdpE